MTRQLPEDPMIRELIRQARRAQISRRSVLAGAGAGATALALAACSTGGEEAPSAAEDNSANDKTLNWANWAAYIDEADGTKLHADVLRPIAPFTETSGTFVNTEGRVQSFNGVMAPRGDTRPGWKVLRVLGNILQLEGFEYDTPEQVRAEAVGYHAPRFKLLAGVVGRLVRVRLLAGDVAVAAGTNRTNDPHVVDMGVGRAQLVEEVDRRPDARTRGRVRGGRARRRGPGDQFGPGAEQGGAYYRRRRRAKDGPVRSTRWHRACIAPRSRTRRTWGRPRSGAPT